MLIDFTDYEIECLMHRLEVVDAIVEFMEEKELGHPVDTEAIRELIQAVRRAANKVESAFGLDHLR